MSAADLGNNTTFENGKYTDEFWQCSISLLAHNVAVNYIGPVITEVLKNWHEKDHADCRVKHY